MSPDSFDHLHWRAATALLLLGLSLAACQPTVAIEAPKEPITINLNIKLDADVRLRIEETAKENIENNPDIFGE
jgi:hypothetical protein